jgi:tyrosine-protein phosphatase SIW14
MKPGIFFISFLLLTQYSFVQSFGQTPARPKEWATKVYTCHLVNSCHLNNLYKLNDSIYRSEQPSKAEFTCLEKEIGIRSVLNLRAHHEDSHLIRGSSLKPFTVKILASKPTNNEIIESLRILKSGPKPILVHCAYGSDRTGLVIAMYRIIFEKWTKEKALEELKKGEYGFHKTYTKTFTNYIDTVNTILIKRMVFN